ncbi:MAG: response regulator [Pyrinomonadaceae bacterium]
MSGRLAPLPVSQANTLPVLAASRSVWFGDEAASTPGESVTEETFEATERKPCALIVDDAPDVVEMLAILLRHYGYQVTTAASAPDALTAARAESFDVIVSDIGMPGMNGYDLALALRELPAYESVPMIALTGFAMYGDRDRALAAGFNAFLAKPINPPALIELIERLRE